MTDATGAAAGTGAAGTAAAGTSATAGAAAAGTGAAAPWYGDKIDETTRGFWQNKGLDPSDPVNVAAGLTKFYREFESWRGVPPEELVRIPKPNAPESDIRAYWGKIGVPAEAKEYDLSTVKFSDGSALDTGFADMFRAAAHSARIPKDQAAPMLTALVKHMEANDSAELAEKTATIKAEREALDKNWGTNRTYNLAVAERALQDIGKAAGLTPEQAKAGWDAISLTGGIGASFAMEMLRFIGSRMNTGPNGEPQFIGGGANQPNNQVMSAAQAKAKIDELKMDKAFYKRMVQDKEVAAKREWEDLHKIAFGRAA